MGLWVEPKPATVEVDGGFEVVPVAVAAGGHPDGLDAGVEAFRAGVHQYAHGWGAAIGYTIVVAFAGLLPRHAGRVERTLGAVLGGVPGDDPALRGGDASG